MSWKALSNDELGSWLQRISDRTKGCDCGIHYSPEKDLKLVQFPDWETAAMQDTKSHVTLARFTGVTPIEITTQDTLTLGSLEQIEYARVENTNIANILLTGLAGECYVVKFRFAGCEINTDAI